MKFSFSPKHLKKTLNNQSKMKRPLIIIFIVLLVDQVSKFLVKTNMYLGQEFNVVGDWFIIHFTENNGMAFGMEFGGDYGKIFLSVFRIFAVAGIGWYLHHLVKTKAHPGYINCMALVFAGAFGNIIDSVFYGRLFSDSFNRIAEFLPEEGGYAPLLQGKVVDMLYFPIIQGHFPSWFPIWANEEFLFFRPVFNVADAAITVSVACIILFQKRYFKEEKDSENSIKEKQEVVS